MQDTLSVGGVKARGTVSELGAALRVGDVVFIQVGALPFCKVAATTLSWVNHVGVVVEAGGREPLVAESTFPFSRVTPLSRFVARSRGRRLGVSRLTEPLSDAQCRAVQRASRARLGIRYDTGFNLHSRGQFCSRFVREVLAEAVHVTVGEVETFAALLERNPSSAVGFWRLWYFGRIPWRRETVTPASLLRSPRLSGVFDGRVA